jgi:hypothetical protein
LEAGDLFLELELPTFCFLFKTIKNVLSEQKPIGFFYNISDRRDKFEEERDKEKKSKNSCYL